MREPKVGDRVKAIGGCAVGPLRFYKDNDVATLTYQDPDGDWWGIFDEGQGCEPRRPGNDRGYCLGLYPEEFELIDD